MATKNLEKEEMRKTQIVEAAYEVISSKGYNNFTIEDIANQAGLSKGGVLHYFKTKEDILIHLLEQIYKAIEDTIKKRSEKYRTPEKKMKAIIIAYIITAKRDPAFYIVMVDFWAQVSINERVKSINTKIFERMSSEVKRVIDLGKDKGIFIDVNSSNAAYTITSMVVTIAAQWTLNKSLFNIDHIARASMAMVMAYLLKGKPAPNIK